VLTKVPSFGDADPNRLTNLKSLASRCLVKDLDSRLQLVSWEDFILEGAKDPLTTLRARLAKGRPNFGNQVNAAAASRLDFDRSEFFRRFSEKVRTELLPVCGTNMPLTLHLSAPGEPEIAHLLLTVDANWTIECALSFDWQAQIYERTANLQMQARLVRAQVAAPNEVINKMLVVVATIAENESEAATSVAETVAQVVANALDRLESAEDPNDLDGFELLS
jgi:eukaryotic-like serine/threonine-protein kinase